MLELIVILGIGIVAALGYRFLLLPALVQNGENPKHGKELRWKVDENTTTRLISNRALANLQKYSEEGGILRNTDVVIVWAQEFLDHDILYDTVLENVKKGIKYVYVLDVCHAKKFRLLLERLSNDLERNAHQVEKGVDVLFVRNDLTLNNFVCMCADSDKQILFSSIIYSDRAFGWFQQAPERATMFVNRVKLMLAAAAMEQEHNEHGESERDVSALEDELHWDEFSNRVFLLEDQLMDFRPLVREARMKRGQISKPSDLLGFNISSMVLPTLFPDHDQAIGRLKGLEEAYDQENVVRGNFGSNSDSVA